MQQQINCKRRWQFWKLQYMSKRYETHSIIRSIRPSVRPSIHPSIHPSIRVKLAYSRWTVGCSEGEQRSPTMGSKWLEWLLQLLVTSVWSNSHYSLSPPISWPFVIPKTGNRDCIHWLLWNWIGFILNFFFLIKVSNKLQKNTKKCTEWFCCFKHIYLSPGSSNASNRLGYNLFAIEVRN